MLRSLLALALLYGFAAYAQSGRADDPVETVGSTGIVLFALIFFGAIAVYVWLTWRKSKKSPDDANRGGTGPVERI